MVKSAMTAIVILNHVHTVIQPVLYVTHCAKLCLVKHHIAAMELPTMTITKHATMEILLPKIVIMVTLNVLFVILYVT